MEEKPKMKRILFEVREDLYKDIKKDAVNRDMTMKRWLAEAIVNNLEEMSKLVRH